MTRKAIVVGFLAGLVGMAVVLLAWTAYTDHVKVNIIWSALQRQAQSAPAPK